MDDTGGQKTYLRSLENTKRLEKGSIYLEHIVLRSLRKSYSETNAKVGAKA